MTSTLLRLLRSPAQFMVVVTVVGAACGMLQAVVAARAIGPAGYGIIGVIAGINAIATNTIDVRLTDLAARLFFASREGSAESQARYRSSVVRICLLINAGIGLAIFTLAVTAGLFFSGYFTDASIDPAWVVSHAAVAGATYFGGTVYFLQRFSQRFYLMGTARLMSQALATTTFIGILYAMPSLDGYYVALPTATAILLAVSLGTLIHLWRRDELPMTGGLRLALPDYRASIGFIWSTNLFGYTKMLHRGADVLVVGYFCSDHMTGLYKVARTISDSFYVIYDGLNQVYFPRFLDLLRLGRHQEYRRLAGRMLIGAGALTAAIVTAELGLLDHVIETLLTAQFVEASPAAIILTMPFLYVVGVRLWVWPAIVHAGQPAVMAKLGALAVLVQYGATVGLLALVSPVAIMAAAGYALYYVFLLVAVLLFMRRHHREITPLLRSPRSPSRTVKQA